MSLRLTLVWAIAQKKLTYDKDILPICGDKCLGCHNADKVKGGLDASTFAKLMEGGSSGEVIRLAMQMALGSIGSYRTRRAKRCRRRARKLRKNR